VVEDDAVKLGRSNLEFRVNLVEKEVFNRLVLRIRYREVKDFFEALLHTRVEILRQRNSSSF